MIRVEYAQTGNHEDQLSVFPVPYEKIQWDEEIRRLERKACMEARQRKQKARDKARRRRFNAWATGIFFGSAILFLAIAIILDLV